jgi:DinB superfamily
MPSSNRAYAHSDNYLFELRETVNTAAPKLLALGDASAARPAAGKWSPREIIGHLVDSAMNNYGRIVRGQLQDDLIFPGYAQKDWVRIGRYHDAPWEELVTLWRTINLQVARAMEGTPEDARRRPRERHNFDVLGVGLLSAESATLEHIMKDYVGHLQHHLRQIFAE